MTLVDNPTSLNGQEALEIGRLADKIGALLSEQDKTTDSGDFKVQLTIDGRELDGAVMPASVLKLVAELLLDVASGREVTVAPYGIPLGTEAIAAVLGVSRPWVASLVDNETLPGTKVGTKRRVPLGAVIDYRRNDDRQRAVTDWAWLDEDEDLVEDSTDD